MAKQTKNSDWKQLLSGGSIVVAVVGTLILAWALQADPADPAGQMVIESSIPDHQFPAPIPIEEVEPDVDPPALEIAPAPVEPAPPSDALDDRAAADLARMKAAGNGYTLQFASLCSQDSVRLKLKSLSGYESFYLIPTGAECHRLCWGLYPTREAALAARGIPAALADIAGDPLAIPLYKAAP